MTTKTYEDMKEYRKDVINEIFKEIDNAIEKNKTDIPVRFEVSNFNRDYQNIRIRWTGEKLTK